MSSCWVSFAVPPATRWLATVMNRQFAQILIGATALTGAFFFGSVMQRRHGDLDTKATPQPMLESEDLVWHTDPARSLAAPDSAKGTSDDIARSVRQGSSSPENNSATAAAGGGENVAALSGQGSALSTATGETGTRKVVQPDFSRWSAPPDSEPSIPERPSPLLPLRDPPPLLVEPNQPTGELVSPPLTVSADPWQTTAPANASERAVAPEVDPWTAPLSSVLLKPFAAPNTAGSTAELPASTATSDTAPRGPDPAVSEAGVPPIEHAGAQSSSPTPARALPTPAESTGLVPVNHPFSPRIEIDTDSFRVHVTRAGDTLQSLASKYYGSVDFYLDIYLANQDQLDSPINLPPGKSLKIPDYGK